MEHQPLGQGMTKKCSVRGIDVVHPGIWLCPVARMETGVFMFERSGDFGGPVVCIVWICVPHIKAIRKGG